MLRPLLFIGLGGAGGKTLRAAKQQLHATLVAKGYEGEIPAAWQFLQIDLTRDGASFPAPMLSMQEFFSVVPPGITFDDLVKKVESFGTPAEMQKMLAGWGTPSTPIVINCGAGQYRAIGRLALVASLNQTFGAIKNTIERMTSSSAETELINVSKILGLDVDVSTPQVIIISSLGGGSGSGMFLDLSELVKSATTEPWGRQSISLLYTPEVFASLGLFGNAVAMNAFGAMNEIIASRGSGLSGATRLLYSRSGIPDHADSYSDSYGSQTNLLIGTRSVQMDDFILQFGNKLADAVTNDELFEFLTAQITDQKSPRGDISDDSRLTSKPVLASEKPLVNIAEDSQPLWAAPWLIEPILEQRARTQNDVQTWAHFWDGRRTRPLTESIPLEQEIRRSIITGWFTAGFLGMREIVQDNSGRKVRIWNPTLQTPDWSSLPNPLIIAHQEDLEIRSWVLPQLLISAGLALADYGKTGNSDYIDSYRLLKHFGREVTASIRNRDCWDHPQLGDLLPSGEHAKPTYIQNWVHNGNKPAEALELIKGLDGVHGSSQERAEALILTIEKFLESFSEQWQRVKEEPWHQLSETWELREDIELALQDMRKYVERL